MAMMDNLGAFADPSAAGIYSVPTTPDAIFGQTHTQDTDAYDTFVQLTGPAAMMFPALPILPAKKMSVYDYRSKNAMTAASPLQTAHRTKQPASKDTVSDEAETNQSNLEWVRYDQTSFINSDVALRAVHVCDLPGIGRKRGRREPLTESKRKKTAEMRKLKSCLMCKMKKKDVS